MRLIAAIVGGVLVLVALRGTQSNSSATATDGKGLWPLLKADFEPGQNGNFLAYAVAIALIGALGYVSQLKGVSTLMLVLVLVVLLMSAVKRNPNLLSEAASAVQKAG